MEDLGEREQYSKTSIFGRIYQHYTTREQTAFTLNHHHTTTFDNSRLPENMSKPCFRVLPEQKQPGYMLGGCKRRGIRFYQTTQIQDPPTFCSKQQEARGLHSVRVHFFQKSARHQEDFFKTELLYGLTTKRSRTELYPSSF